MRRERTRNRLAYFNIYQTTVGMTERKRETVTASTHSHTHTYTQVHTHSQIQVVYTPALISSLAQLLRNTRAAVVVVVVVVH